MIITRPIPKSIEFKRESFTVTNPLIKTYGLFATPKAESETVSLNGLDQLPGLSEQYTISGSNLVINADVTIRVNDVIAIHYCF